MYKAGDVVWVEFDPAVGHEQAGRRPALVVSEGEYNHHSSLLLVCPITRSQTPWPFKVAIPENEVIDGVVLVDQVKSIDRSQRVVRHKGRLSSVTLNEVRGKLAALLGIQAATISRGTERP